MHYPVLQTTQVIGHNYAIFLGSYMFQPTQPSAGLLWTLHAECEVFSFAQNILKFLDLQVNVYLRTLDKCKDLRNCV